MGRSLELNNDYGPSFKGSGLSYCGAQTQSFDPRDSIHLLKVVLRTTLTEEQPTAEGRTSLLRLCACLFVHFGEWYESTACPSIPIRANPHYLPIATKLSCECKGDPISEPKDRNSI